MSLYQAFILILKCTTAGLIIAVLGGQKFLFPLFTDLRAVFCYFMLYLTGYRLNHAFAAVLGCAVLGFVMVGNVYALSIIATDSPHITCFSRNQFKDWRWSQ